MNLPDHLRKPLEEVDFKALAPRPYEEKLAVLKKESQKLQQISEWLNTPGKAPADGLRVFFDYLSRVLTDMTGSGKNCICTSWYELESPLYGVFLRLILKEEQKAEALKKISKGLEETITRCSQSAYAYSLIVQKFLDNYRGIKEKWELGEGNALAAKEFIIWMLTFRTELFLKKKTEADAYYLKSITIYFQDQIYALWEREPNPAADEFVLFEFTAWSPHNSLQVSRYIENLSRREPLKAPADFPEPAKLFTKGKALFESKRSEGLLLMLIDSFLKSLHYATGQMEALKNHQASGANIANVSGVSAASDALEGIGAYTASRASIAAYLAGKISDDESLALLAAIIAHEQYALVDSKPKDNVVKELCLKLCDPGSKAPGQTAIKRLCVKWKLIGTETLPAKDRFKAPRAFPEDAAGLADWHKLLMLKTTYKMGRKASEKDVPVSWPKDIRSVYLSFNGSKQREFLPLSKTKKLLKEIFEARDMHLEDLDDEEPEFNSRKGELDVRKHLHKDIIPLGSDASGDIFFIDTRSKSLSRKAPVLRFHHDQPLMARVEANSLIEFLGRQFIMRYETINGADKALEKLMKQKTGLLKK